MTADFRALDISYEVQKSFANKFFSNKNVAKGLIDNSSATLLDELYKLVKIFVSWQTFDPCPSTNQSTSLKSGSLFLVMVSVRTYVRTLRTKQNKLIKELKHFSS